MFFTEKEKDKIQEAFDVFGEQHNRLDSRFIDLSRAFDRHVEETKSDIAAINEDIEVLSGLLAKVVKAVGGDQASSRGIKSAVSRFNKIKGILEESISSEEIPTKPRKTRTKKK